MEQTIFAVKLKERGLTGVALARRIGVADSLVSHWRKGRIYVPEKYREQIARMLGVPAEQLFDERGLPKVVKG